MTAKFLWKILLQSMAPTATHHLVFDNKGEILVILVCCLELN